MNASIEISANVGKMVCERLDALIWQARSRNYEPKAIAMSGTNYLSLRAELAERQRLFALDALIEYMGLPVFVGPSCALQLLYAPDEAPRLCWEAQNPKEELSK